MASSTTTSTIISRLSVHRAAVGSGAPNAGRIDGTDTGTTAAVRNAAAPISAWSSSSATTRRIQEAVRSRGTPSDGGASGRAGAAVVVIAPSWLIAADPVRVFPRPCDPCDPRVTYNHMVVREQTQGEVDRVFAALADATRRDIVQRVLRREASVSHLAQGYEMSFAAVQKHVAVLERAGLVVKVRHGREQVVHPDVGTIRAAARLLEQYEEIWRGRLDRIDAILTEP
jgi:DNA-binding transcriptional ArsR family regulator